MSKKLPPELRRAINRASFAAGAAHGEEVKRRMLADAADALATGKPAAEILAAMATPEAIPPAC